MLSLKCGYPLNRGATKVGFHCKSDLKKTSLGGVSKIFSIFPLFKISILIEKVRWISIFVQKNPWNHLANNCKLSSSRCFFQNLTSSSSFYIMFSSYITVEKNHAVPNVAWLFKKCFLRHSACLAMQW